MTLKEIESGGEGHRSAVDPEPPVKKRRVVHEEPSKTAADTSSSMHAVDGLTVVACSTAVRVRQDTQSGTAACSPPDSVRYDNTGDVPTLLHAVDQLQKSAKALVDHLVDRRRAQGHVVPLPPHKQVPKPMPRPPLPPGLLPCPVSPVMPGRGASRGLDVCQRPPKAQAAELAALLEKAAAAAFAKETGKVADMARALATQTPKASNTPALQSKSASTSSRSAAFPTATFKCTSSCASCPVTAQGMSKNASLCLEGLTSLREVSPALAALMSRM